MGDRLQQFKTSLISNKSDFIPNSEPINNEGSGPTQLDATSGTTFSITQLEQVN